MPDENYENPPLLIKIRSKRRLKPTLISAWLQVILNSLLVAIAALSVFYAKRQADVSESVARLNKETVHATQVPALSLILSIDGTPGGTDSLVISNAGLGPAVIRTIQAEVAGNSALSWVDVLSLMGIPPPYQFVEGVLSNHVI